MENNANLEFSQEELIRRNGNSDAFELHQMLYCDLEPTFETFRSIARSESKENADGFLCILNRDEPVFQALTFNEFLLHVSNNCSPSCKLGVGPKHSVKVRYAIKHEEVGYDTVQYGVLFEDAREFRSMERFSILNQDEEGNVTETYLDTNQNVYTRYASTILSDFYWRMKG